MTDSELSTHASRWRTVSSFPSLDRGSVHVWRADISALAPCASYFDALIEGGERARGNAYHASADRLRHTVTRGVLRALAGHYVGASPSALRFDAGPFGKPALRSDDEPTVSFNLSHSGDIVLLAFARDGDVGVDVERWSNRLGDLERGRIAESVFSNTECDAIRALPAAAERERAFYTLWSRKEAYLKGTGAGISSGLSHVDITVDATARLIEDRRDASAAERWGICDIDVGVGYSAALAHTPPHQEVVLLQPPLHLFEGRGG